MYKCYTTAGVFGVMYDGYLSNAEDDPEGAVPVIIKTVKGNGSVPWFVSLLATVLYTPSYSSPCREHTRHSGQLPTGGRHGPPTGQPSPSPPSGGLQLR